MSFFKVEKLKISKIFDHPNADKLSLANVETMSFQFCIRKDEFKEGEYVLYFPVDAVLPQPLINHLGIANFLAGVNKNRIKTVKLRGSISQGYVASLESVVNYLNNSIEMNFTQMVEDGPFSTGYSSTNLPNDVTEILGVEKWEAPATLEKNARLLPLNGRIETYDLEGSQRFPYIIDYMMDKLISISEKCEGMNGGASVFSDGKLTVNQRNFFIEPLDGAEHTFWNLVNKYKLHEIGNELIGSRFNDKSITFRFEVLGPSIQGNLYKLPAHDIRLFDIKVDDKYIDVEQFLEICEKYKLPTVPILAKNVTLREWLNGETFEEAANGKSVLYDGLREGIVCKLMHEEEIEGYGRSIVKNRSVQYLAKTEY